MPETKTVTPVITPVVIKTDERAKKIQQIASIGGSVGLLGGLIYAFHGKKSFFGYVGYSILFSIIGSTTAGIGANILVKKQD